jgi:hypothetical protein
VASQPRHAIASLLNIFPINSYRVYRHYVKSDYVIDHVQGQHILYIKRASPLEYSTEQSMILHSLFDHV